MVHIKNIIKIEITDADNIKSMLTPAAGICILPQDAEFREIKCKHPSSCEITDKVESKIRIFTTKLTFKSCEQMNHDGSPAAYRITTADGSRYIIGHYYRPFPVVTQSETMPSSHTDSSLISYTVAWTDVVKPLLII